MNLPNGFENIFVESQNYKIILKFSQFSQKFPTNFQGSEGSKHISRLFHFQVLEKLGMSWEGIRIFGWFWNRWPLISNRPNTCKDKFNLGKK